jgi:uncharacterized membrane protein YjjP (DUF1212 family)
MKARYNEELVLDTAHLAGCLILENGGETFRAEETVLRICMAGGYGESEVIAIPTGIFVTLADGDISYKTRVKRIRKRWIDLRRIDRTNTISRSLASGEIGFEEAFGRLRELNAEDKSTFELPLRCIYSALATGLFTLVGGGSLFDGAIAFICGAVVQLLSASFSRINIFPFITSLLGSMLIAAITVTAVYYTGLGSIDKIIVGAIIPLLPGLATINAVRDTIMGDLISGSARFTEALLSAVGIAGGVGMVFGIYVGFGGVL